MEKIRFDAGTYIPLSAAPFKSPKKVRRVVCCDFDGTYLPFDKELRPRSGIIGLEDFLDEHNGDLSIAMGWISGSSLWALARKSEKYVRRLPHFIASSLGTEFYWVTETGFFPSLEWAERIAGSGFHLDDLRKAVREIRSAGIDLQPQHSDFQGQVMECHFYKPSANVDAEKAIMDEVCALHNVKLVMSRCNPFAGDPEGHYDAQFMPIPCGKAEAAAFAADVFGVPRSEVWAFGDSMNDMEMLSYASNSYLVANADPEAKKVFGNVLSGEFCHGIREKLSELLV